MLFVSLRVLSNQPWIIEIWNTQTDKNYYGNLEISSYCNELLITFDWIEEPPEVHIHQQWIENFVRSNPCDFFESHISPELIQPFDIQDGFVFTYFPITHPPSTTTEICSDEDGASDVDR